MDLNKCKQILRSLYVVGFGLIFIALLAPQNLFFPLLGTAAAVLLAQTVFRFKFWRCPKCGALLSKHGKPHCDMCTWSQI